MPQQYRETTITVFGKTQVIRTERKTTFTAMERAHTKAVREALIEAYAAVPESKKKALKTRLEKRIAELDAKQVYILSERYKDPDQVAIRTEMTAARNLLEVIGKHKFTPAKSSYVDGKPLPKVRYTDTIPDSVKEYHEYVQDALV